MHSRGLAWLGYAGLAWCGRLVPGPHEVGGDGDHQEDDDDEPDRGLALGLFLLQGGRLRRRRLGNRLALGHVLQRLGAFLHRLGLGGCAEQDPRQALPALLLCLCLLGRRGRLLFLGLFLFLRLGLGRRFLLLLFRLRLGLFFLLRLRLRLRLRLFFLLGLLLGLRLRLGLFFLLRLRLGLFFLLGLRLGLLFLLGLRLGLLFLLRLRLGLFFLLGLRLGLLFLLRLRLRLRLGLLFLFFFQALIHQVAWNSAGLDQVIDADPLDRPGLDCPGRDLGGSLIERVRDLLHSRHAGRLVRELRLPLLVRQDLTQHRLTRRGQLVEPHAHTRGHARLVWILFPNPDHRAQPGQEGAAILELKLKLQGGPHSQWLGRPDEDTSLADVNGVTFDELLQGGALELDLERHGAGHN